MTTSSRKAAFCILYSHSKDGVLERGALKKTAEMFSVDGTTMGRLWREILKKIEDESVAIPDILHDLSFFESKSSNRGRPLKWDKAEMREAAKLVPFQQRNTFRQMSSATKIPKSTLFDMFKKGLFRRHTSSLRPHLTEENKVARLFHALEEVYPVVGPGGQLHFKDFFDRIDIDEKWFFLTRAKETYILIADDEDSDGEEEPNRRVRHKSHITKVMFLCAQARPRWDTTRNRMWDGKIGIWPIGHWEAAQRRSTTRDAGVPVWRDETVTKDKYRKLLLEKVVPAIAEKWPRREWNNARFIIRIQQDGAKSHIHPTDMAFAAAMKEKGLDNKILLYTQPANSPDTNINNLRFSCAL